MRPASREVSVDRRYLSARAIGDLKHEATTARARLDLNRRRQIASADFHRSVSQAKDRSAKVARLQGAFDDKSRLVERLAP